MMLRSYRNASYRCLMDGSREDNTTTWAPTNLLKVCRGAPGGCCLGQTLAASGDHQMASAPTCLPTIGCPPSLSTASTTPSRMVVLFYDPQASLPYSSPEPTGFPRLALRLPHHFFGTYNHKVPLPPHSVITSKLLGQHKIARNFKFFPQFFTFHKNVIPYSPDQDVCFLCCCN